MVMGREEKSVSGDGTLLEMVDIVKDNPLNAKTVKVEDENQQKSLLV